MGSLRDFDIRSFQEAFNLSVLVETGTGAGDSIQHALDSADWAQIHSIDIDDSVLRGASERFKNSIHVHLWHGKSQDVLPHILENIAGQGPTLFWLDAHFPGECSGRRLDSEEDMALRLPLETELRIIATRRSAEELASDMFLLDDAWIYRDGVADCGDWEERIETAQGATDEFIAEILGPTHQLAVDHRSTGVTIAIPRTAPRQILEGCFSETERARMFWEG